MTNTDLTPEGIELIAGAIAEADVGHSVTLIRLVDGEHTVRATFDEDVRDFTDDVGGDAHDKAYAFIRESKRRVQAECVMRALAACATPPAPQETAGERGDWCNSSGFLDRKGKCRNPDGCTCDLILSAQRAHPTPTAAPTDNAALVEEIDAVLDQAHADLDEYFVDAKHTGERPDLQDSETMIPVDLLERIRAAFSSRTSEATSRESLEELDVIYDLVVAFQKQIGGRLHHANPIIRRGIVLLDRAEYEPASPKASGGGA